MAAEIRSEVPKTADVVVIGGGVYGCSVAYNLANQGAGNVVILERGNLGSGGTAKSCAIVRTHYSIHVNMVHAVESLKIFESFGEAVGGDILAAADGPCRAPHIAFAQQVKRQIAAHRIAPCKFRIARTL